MITNKADPSEVPPVHEGSATAARRGPVGDIAAQRRQFASFLALHAHKARVTPDPVAHLHFVQHPSDDLVACAIQDVMDELDTESDLVRWLLRQLTTYDPTRERVVGLVFDERTVLSEVLRAP